MQRLQLELNECLAEVAAPPIESVPPPGATPQPDGKARPEPEPSLAFDVQAGFGQIAASGFSETGMCGTGGVAFDTHAGYSFGAGGRGFEISVHVIPALYDPLFSTSYDGAHGPTTVVELLAGYRR